MDSDDPFSNDRGDRTVIRPMPGGRGVNSPGNERESVTPAPKPQSPATPVQADFATPGLAMDAVGSRGAGDIPFTGQIPGSGLNPLVDAASSLLNLASQLRNSVSQENVLSLRDHVTQQVRLFEDKARAGGCDQDSVLTARYLLCTYLDESVLSTPWGSESDWASQSLLSTFHNETWGGEKFFQVLDQRIAEPSRNLNLLELVFICLSFGFQGKYGISDRGSSQLLEIQDNLIRTISMQRGDFERELSPHWQGVADKRYALVRYVPLWVVGALAGVLLLIVYAGFRLIIGSTTAPIYEDIERIKLQPDIELRE